MKRLLLRCHHRWEMSHMHPQAPWPRVTHRTSGGDIKAVTLMGGQADMAGNALNLAGQSESLLFVAGTHRAPTHHHTKQSDSEHLQNKRLETQIIYRTFRREDSQAFAKFVYRCHHCTQTSLALSGWAFARSSDDHTSDKWR